MQKAEKKDETSNLNKSEHTLKKIIYAYKKFKQIAKIELKTENESIEYRKNEILNGIHLLLDDYLRLFNQDIKKENLITFSPSKTKSFERDDFNGFFE